MDNSITNERMTEILEAYTEFRDNTYEHNARRIKRNKDMGSSFPLSQEQACHIQDHINYSHGDEELDAIFHIFFTEATIRDQPKIYNDLYNATLKSIQYIYDNIATYPLPEFERNEFLSYAKKVGVMLKNVDVINDNRQF